MMDDVIYRKDAIDAIKMDTDIIPFVSAREYSEAALDTAHDRILKLPSAQRWILCSERMPYYDEEILVSYRGRVRIASRTRNDKEYPWYIIDGRFNVKTVDAWMPLPEPPEPYEWKTDE